MLRNDFEPAPVMLDARQVADLLRVSGKHLRQLVRGGRVPQPVRLGACLRWPRQVVESWLDAGCPDCEPERGQAADE
jgi:predicted DNA-binding transcriptional regulator AlpA